MLVRARGGALPSEGNTISYVIFYGVVSAQTERVVEFFLGREAAKAMLREVREDEPVLAEDLRVDQAGSRRTKDGKVFSLRLEDVPDSESV